MKSLVGIAAITLVLSAYVLGAPIVYFDDLQESIEIMENITSCHKLHLYTPAEGTEDMHCYLRDIHILETCGDKSEVDFIAKELKELSKLQNAGSNSCEGKKEVFQTYIKSLSNSVMRIRARNS